jgi:hypothetical protein
MEIGDIKESKHWMGRIIDEIPLHQIPANYRDPKTGKGTKLIEGYWNALVSWEDNPANNAADERMGRLYREVLKERGVLSAKPGEVEIPDTSF